MKTMLVAILLVMQISATHAETQVLRDRNGNIVGRVEESNGKIVGRDANGNYSGSYDPKSNTTRDVNGNIAGYGNQITNQIKRR